MINANFVLPYYQPQCMWGGAAHREADGREYHPLLRFSDVPQFSSHVAVRAATAHREADGREYHPLRWSAGMRVCGYVGEQAYSKIVLDWATCVSGNFASALPSGLEDGRAGGISMSLEFLVLFFQEKSTESRHEHYPQFKIINMNGRLYDPVIGRFFSPDKYVANSSFTQDIQKKLI
jgi:hypothetical protein